MKQSDCCSAIIPDDQEHDLCPKCKEHCDIVEIEEEKTFKIVDIDNGFCRITYKAKNGDNKTVYYCLQDEGKNHGGVCCYRSTSDWEPDYPISYAKRRFEVPTGDSEIEVSVRNYLTGV